MKLLKQIGAFVFAVLLPWVMAAQASAAGAYTIKAGDTLFKIAKAQGLTVLQLKQYNSLQSDMIYIGQKLILSPVSKYVVQKGDSLWLIATRHGVTVNQLKAENNLKSDMIYIGQGLTIPGPAGTSAPLPGTKPVLNWPSVTYTVKEGDTLGGIAKKYGTTVETLMKYNYMDQGEWLNAGQKAAISGYAPRNFAVTPGESASPMRTGKRVDWFLDGKYLIKRNDTFIVTDVATGLQIKFVMMGGANHADVEPLTKAETAKLQKLFPEWNWTPRPVVIFHKGINFAASLSGMPHSFDTVDNDVSGHFDLYLHNSKNHGTSVSQTYVKQHLDNVKTAAGMQ